ncbi:unnamed protein product, partial [Ceratitis capitata]
MAEIKSMEHATLKVPYEVLNKKFRISQKNVDREMDQIHNITKDVEKIVGGKSILPTVTDVGTLVENVVQRIHVLKRKADESFSEEINAGLACKRKLQHLKIITFPDSHIGYDAWQASIEQWKMV